MAGFLIDGREYEVPTLESFNMGEAMVLEEYSGLTLNQFTGGDTMSVGLAAALMHIAYARSHTDKTKAEIRALVEGSNLVGALEALSEDDAGPPDGAGQTPTLNGLVSSLSSSGRSSSATSDGRPEGDQKPTGTLVSGMSAASAFETSRS